MFPIALIGALCIGLSQEFLLSRELPCEYLESVNITDGAKLDNGQILHDGVVYPKELYAKINYDMDYYGKTRHIVQPYVRGCLCRIKPCIRLCCPRGQFVDLTQKTGKKCRKHEAAKNYASEMINQYNRTVSIVLDDHFGFVDDRPCHDYYLADTYNITHTGDVIHENRTVGHERYCLKSALDEETNETDLGLLICYEEADRVSTRFSVLPYGMLLSVPFIIATILVYVLIPELCNLHGKCLLCYLMGLVVGYVALAMVQLNGSNYVEPLICKSFGHLIYFTFLSAFLWLSVLSFDLWWNFRTTSVFKMFSDRKRFFLYMIYAWGLASLLTLMAYVLDSSESLPESLQPGIGVGTCFMKKERLTQFLFFYMPACIIFTINVIFFFLTAIKIRQVQQDLCKITSQEESSRHQNNLNQNKDNFTLYLRLFIVMGVTWSMEAISFLISPDSNLFFLTDICNTIQGVLIFVLFVLKRRVLRLIKKRWHVLFGKAISNGSSITHSTSATYRTSNLRLNQISTPCEKKNPTFA